MKGKIVSYLSIPAGETTQLIESKYEGWKADKDQFKKTILEKKITSIKALDDLSLELIVCDPKTNGQDTHISIQINNNDHMYGLRSELVKRLREQSIRTIYELRFSMDANEVTNLTHGDILDIFSFLATVDSCVE